MLTGYFAEYKGYKGTIEYDYEDGKHHGVLIGIKDFVNYTASDVNELYNEYCNAINSYIEVKGELNG